MPLLLLALVVAVVGSLVVVEIRRSRKEQLLVGLLGIFGAALARGREHPRELVGLMDVAIATRKLFPKEYQELDRMSGFSFPFQPDLVEAAHARWTAEWLAWERQHDLVYKRKAGEIEAELDHCDGETAALARMRLATIEQEKLQLYQQRYEEYVQVGKVLGALSGE